MEDYRKRCAELVKKLNESSEVYYNGGEEIIPNYEWDAMFDELLSYGPRSLRSFGILNDFNRFSNSGCFSCFGLFGSFRHF